MTRLIIAAALFLAGCAWLGPPEYQCFEKTAKGVPMIYYQCYPEPRR